MTIIKIQTITNLIDENEQLISSSISESYKITPEVGKALKNVLTNEVISGAVFVNQKSKIKNFIEIELIRE